MPPFLHHATVLPVKLGAPGESNGVQPEATALLNRLEDGETSLKNFRADAVARNGRDAVCSHSSREGSEMLHNFLPERS